MPELPELEVVCEVLQRRLVGHAISAVQVLPPGGPVVVRDLTHRGFVEALTGATVAAVARRGKCLVFTFDLTPAHYLVLNPKLTGRLQLVAPDEKRRARTHVILTLSGGGQLRYVDQKRMGQLYLTHDPALVPDFDAMGPEALEVARDEFRARLRAYRGEIKGILTRGACVAGIGNAYADEILWAARLHPYRKRTQLTAEEIDRLYDAMRATLLDAIGKVRAEMREDTSLEPRDFLAVHMKTGEPCPRCGTPISLVGANQRITNFCRTCQPGGVVPPERNPPGPTPGGQPGGLIKGM
jgi:formamidopyrimidine-DNA glycosylase